jgi:hypothetical protein
VSTQNIKLSFMRLLIGVALLLVLSSSTQAVSLKDYQNDVNRAVTALDSLAQQDEEEEPAPYEQRLVETLQGVRNLLAQSVVVEWNGTNFSVDNLWLHQEIDAISGVAASEKAARIERVKERLQAISERLSELQRPAKVELSKEEANRKLGEILLRPEYATKAKGQSFISRMIDRFLKWFQNLFPQPKPIAPGKAGIFSVIAQWFVIILALAVLAYVLKLLLPRIVRPRRKKKTEKKEPRIVLGEKLEPDQSAVDLLADAEALARSGDLRAAIRKAYIALLVELGDRKIISLAQHKTNRDYLRSVQENRLLYGNVAQLTDSFERHWYGFAQVDENDWQAFRSTYQRALL